MKAIVYTKYGPPENLELKEVEKPTPEDDEVLVKVYAVAINDWDWNMLSGIPTPYRIFSGFLKPKHNILGSDVAGRVEAVGKNVKQLKLGDDVYGDLCECGWGGFAEYVCANEKALAIKPASMTFEQAAAIPQAAMLAVQGFRVKGTFQPGQKLLINGAGGGVGTFGVQIAKLSGVDVTGVDHTTKLDLMRSVGFDHVIDYTQEDFTKNGQQYDLILDTKTNRSLFDYIRVLQPNGIYATVGGTVPRLLQAFFMGPLISLVSKKQIRVVGLKPNKELTYMNELFEAGNMKPVIDGPYTLRELPKAMRLFAEANHKGKVVITVQHNNKT